MPTLLDVVRLASGLLSLHREKLLSSLIRPARLILAVLGGFVLVGVWQLVMTTQGRVQTAWSFHSDPPAEVSLAGTQSYSDTTSCAVVSGDPGSACDYADLAVEKTVSDSTPREGDTIVYTIIVTNHGPRNATSVKLTDELPAGVTYITHTVSQGSHTNTWWTMPGLANGANAILTITATVDTATSGQTITNTATGLIADQADQNPNNNEDSVGIIPERSAYFAYLPLIFKRPPPPCHVEIFANPASGWYTSTGPPTLLGYNGGKYHMFTQDTSVLHWARSPLGPFSAYSVQVDVNWANTTYVGEEYGIVFDLSTSSDLAMYRFNVDTSAGTYVLGRLHGGWITLTEGVSSDILTGISTNTLRVDRQGSDIDLYINGQYQTSYSDSALPRPAYVGVNVVPGDTVNGEAYFDNFTVCTYELNSASAARVEAVPSTGVANKP